MSISRDLLIDTMQEYHTIFSSEPEVVFDLPDIPVMGLCGEEATEIELELGASGF